MSDPYKLPLPKDCQYSHIEDDHGHTHFCHAQWTDPKDPVPWNASVEWYGPRCSRNQMEDQAFLKLLRYIRMEREKDNVESAAPSSESMILFGGVSIILPAVAVVKQQTERLLSLVYAGPVLNGGEVQDITASEFNLIGHGWHYPHVMLRRALRELNPMLGDQFVMHKAGENEIRLVTVAS